MATLRNAIFSAGINRQNQRIAIKGNYQVVQEEDGGVLLLYGTGEPYHLVDSAETIDQLINDHPVTCGGAWHGLRPRPRSRFEQ